MICLASCTVSITRVQNSLEVTMFIMILILLAQRGMYECYLSSCDNNPCNRGWGVLGLPCEVANYLSLILPGRIAILSGLRWDNMEVKLHSILLLLCISIDIINTNSQWSTKTSSCW